MIVKLKLRKTYKSRDGSHVKIVDSEKGDNCTIFIGSDKRRYFDDGALSLIGLNEIPTNIEQFISSQSLIEEI